jgi:hypothetical protein
LVTFSYHPLVAEGKKEVNMNPGTVILKSHCVTTYKWILPSTGFLYITPQLKIVKPLTVLSYNGFIAFSPFSLGNSESLTDTEYL